MDDKIHIGYYAIIPAKIRYDKEITPNAKLLYGEITALCNDRGFCWANNNYFAQLYGVGTQTISRWINELSRKGYITTEIIFKEESKEIQQRNIKIAADPPFKNDDTLPSKNAIPSPQKTQYPPLKNAKDNNTELIVQPNNTDISVTTHKKFTPPTLQEATDYCKERHNNINPTKFIAHYEANGWYVGKVKMKNWKAAIRKWETNDFDKKPQQSTNIFQDMLDERRNK